MAQCSGGNDQFANAGVRCIPIIANISLDGLPKILGLVIAPQPKSEFKFECVESTFILLEDEQPDSERSSTAAEVTDPIDVEVEEEVTLRVFKGAGTDIDTIEEEEEPLEEWHNDEEEKKEEREEEKKEEREEEKKKERVEEKKEEREEEKKEERKEEERVEEKKEARWERVEEKKEERKEEERVEEKKEARWERVGEEEEKKEEREEEKKKERVEEKREGLEEEEKKEEEIGVGIKLQKKRDEEAKVVSNCFGEGITTQRHQRIVMEVREETEERKKLALPSSPMPFSEENTSRTVSIVNEVQASTSRVETTVWGERTVRDDDRTEPVAALTIRPAKDQQVRAVHVRQRMAENGGTFEEETPFLQLETSHSVWRGDEQMVRMNGAEERRKLAEGEAMLKELLEEHVDGTRQTKQDQNQQQQQQISRNVVIQRQNFFRENQLQQQPETNNVQIVHVQVQQKEQQQPFRHDGLYTLLNKNNFEQNSASASGNSHQPAAAVAGAEQNGGGLSSLVVRSPGPHSPFGLEPPEDDEWRLSPKTLSRIKRLNVVMETGGKDGAEVIHHHPVFVKDTSRYWYKPTISREEAIAMLKSKPPGTFIVRDSNSFPGAFGLALKVTQPPAGVLSSGDGNELVRHFLIEPSPKGVRLKGCSNEPVFGTLAALVYQHSITPLALPCRLILPEFDPAATPEHLNSNQALLERGAACNVTYLCSVDTESLTGPEALRRSTSNCFELLQRRELRAVSVHFKVSSQGITLTDNTRSMFFRRHYPGNKVTFAGIDPESRVFDNNNVSQLPPTYVRQAPIFGFVARKSEVADHSGSVENACHLFAELDPDQPASAVVRFITNVMMPVGRAQLHQIHQNVNTR